MPASAQTIRNVPYIADGDFKQKLDIYLPASSDKAFPTLFAIHGGGGDKNDFSRLAAYLVERGYALVSINYRERPQFRHPAPLKDAFCALAWVQANADTYNLDTQRIFAVGHSIGGTLAAMLAVVDDPSEYMQGCPYTLELHSLQGCVTYTGIFDYTAMDQDPNTSLRNYFAGYFGVDRDKAPDLWAQASPITWLDSNDPSFLLIHGLKDNNINPDYSTSFADKLRETGIGFELLLIPDMEHMGIIGSQKSFEAVEAFLANPPQSTTAIVPDDLSIDVPQAATPALDGTLSPGEWDGARRAQLSDGSELLLMHDAGYLYLGIRADAEGIGSICVERDSQVAVLHSSASLGTAVYKQSKENWERVRDFTWTCAAIYDNPEAQAEWAAHLEHEGWLASTVLRGNPAEMEFQIAVPKGAIRLAVAHLKTSAQNSVAWWPARLDDSCRSLRLVQGTALEKPHFSPQTWMTVTTSSHAGIILPAASTSLKP